MATFTMRLGWAATFFCAILIIYQRRITWRCRGEQAITLSIVLQALSISIQLPPFNNIISDGAHWLTGQWNLESFIGYCLALCSVGAAAYHFRAMVDDDDDLRRGFRRHVEAPIAVAVPLLFTFQQCGGIAVRDSLFAFGNDWMKLYWLTFCVAMTWIICYAIRAIRILRAYPSSRTAMTIYLCAAHCGIIAIGVRTVEAVWPLLDDTAGLVAASVFGCASMLLWTAGAAYSWARRIRSFNFRCKKTRRLENDWSNYRNMPL